MLDNRFETNSDESYRKQKML